MCVFSLSVNISLFFSCSPISFSSLPLSRCFSFCPSSSSLFSSSFSIFLLPFLLHTRVCTGKGEEEENSFLTLLRLSTLSRSLTTKNFCLERVRVARLMTENFCRKERCSLSLLLFSLPQLTLSSSLPLSLYLSRVTKVLVAHFSCSILSYRLNFFFLIFRLTRSLTRAILIGAL